MRPHRSVEPEAPVAEANEAAASGRTARFPVVEVISVAVLVGALLLAWRPSADTQSVDANAKAMFGQVAGWQRNVESHTPGR